MEIIWILLFASGFFYLVYIFGSKLSEDTSDFPTSTNNKYSKLYEDSFLHSSFDDDFRLNDDTDDDITDPSKCYLPYNIHHDDCFGDDEDFYDFDDWDTSSSWDDWNYWDDWWNNWDDD